MKITQVMKKALLGFILSVLSINVSYAWDGIRTGKIKFIDAVTNGDNLGYRVYLEGFPKMCGNAHGWAYVTLSDSNYESMVSSLMAVKFADRSVSIYSNADSSTYCHIGYIRIY